MLPSHAATVASIFTVMSVCFMALFIFALFNMVVAAVKKAILELREEDAKAAEEKQMAEFFLRQLGGWKP